MKSGCRAHGATEQPYGAVSGGGLASLSGRFLVGLKHKSVPGLRPDVEKEGLGQNISPDQCYDSLV